MRGIATNLQPFVKGALIDKTCRNVLVGLRFT